MWQNRRLYVPSRMKKFRINSIIFISVIAVIFCCNVYYLVSLYNSIREDVEREVMTALADTDIDDMWERSERALQIARANGKTPIDSKEADSIYYSQHGQVSGHIDESGDFVTNTVKENGDRSQQKSPLRRTQSYTNQMMKAMSQQMHQAMDKYYGYDLTITDSIFAARLADRQIRPDFVAIEIVDANDSVLLANDNLKDGIARYDVFRLCFNPENGWIYRASVTPLTKHILSQMMGVIVTVFLLMVAFAAAFWHLFRTVSKLRTIEEMKDDFISNMTHELKTPISIAYSANDALLNYDTSNNPDKKDAYLRIAMKQLKRLGELVENILAPQTTGLPNPNHSGDKGRPDKSNPFVGAHFHVSQHIRLFPQKIICKFVCENRFRIIMLTLQYNLENIEAKNIKNLTNSEFSSVRIAVDFSDYDIEKDTRILIPFSYYQHYGMMNRAGDVVVEPKFDRIFDSCRKEADVVRVGIFYTYGFNRSTKEPSTYLRTKWGLLDSKGNFILEPEYKQIGVSDDSRILTIQHMDGQYEVISVDGDVIVAKGIYPWIDAFDGGLTRVYVGNCENKKWGIIDSKGKVVLPLQYSNIWNFYKKNRTTTTIEAVDEHQNRLVGSFNLITHETVI